MALLQIGNKATGSTSLAEMNQAKQKCNNWAFLQEFSTVNSKITTDTSDSSVYVSISSSGGCFNVAGGLRTIPVLASTSVNPRDVIPSLEVVCSGATCSTVEIKIEFGYDSYTLPSLAVTCIDNVYTTETRTVTANTYNYFIQIPSLTVGFSSPMAGSLYSLCMTLLIIFINYCRYNYSQKII